MATFDAPGVHVLRVTAHDTDLLASDDVAVTVTGSNPVSPGLVVDSRREPGAAVHGEVSAFTHPLTAQRRRRGCNRRSLLTPADFLANKLARRDVLDPAFPIVNSPTAVAPPQAARWLAWPQLQFRPR